MTSRWPTRLGSMIAIPYLMSFVLPFEDSIGAACFALGFLGLLAGSVFWLALWSPNALLWAGLLCLCSGRWDRVAILGMIACSFASLPLVPVDDGGHILLPSGDFLSISGYFTWLANMVLVAGVGLIGWVTDGFSRRPRVRIGTLVIVIACTALLLALARITPRFMSWLLSRPRGFNVGMFCVS